MILTAVTAFRALFQGCFFAFRILSENQHRPDRLPWPGVVWHPAVLSQIGMGERRYARWKHRQWFREEKRPVPIKTAAGGDVAALFVKALAVTPAAKIGVTASVTG